MKILYNTPYSILKKNYIKARETLVKYHDDKDLPDTTEINNILLKILSEFAISKYL